MKGRIEMTLGYCVAAAAYTLHTCRAFTQTTPNQPHPQGEPFSLLGSRIQEVVIYAALSGFGKAEDLSCSQEADFVWHFVKPADPKAILML
jgi:hypothetical protein